MPSTKKVDILRTAMKKDLQPQVYNDCVITCACGNSFTTISTQQKITVDICSACHPFYTGKQKFIDTEGRIEKFEKKLQISKAKKAKNASLKNKKKAVDANKSDSPIISKSLKDMLEDARKAAEVATPQSEQIEPQQSGEQQTEEQK